MRSSESPGATHVALGRVSPTEAFEVDRKLRLDEALNAALSMEISANMESANLVEPVCDSAVGTL
jgi:hypothetical protein